MTKSESARINGAKSHGPKTEAGRRRSSQNALKHGLTAQSVVLPSEDPAEFQLLLTSYLDQFQPDGPAELHLVHQMVTAAWRLQRLPFIESQLYINAMERAQEYADHRLDPSESLAESFERLANSNSYPFLQRIESRLERTYSRALRNLIQLQRLRKPHQPPGDAPAPSENKFCTNEPTQPVQPNGHLALDRAATVAKPTPPVIEAPWEPRSHSFAPASTSALSQPPGLSTQIRPPCASDPAPEQWPQVSARSTIHPPAPHL
jgi:hypothetical protein